MPWTKLFILLTLFPFCPLICTLMITRLLIVPLSSIYLTISLLMSVLRLMSNGKIYRFNFRFTTYYLCRDSCYSLYFIKGALMYHLDIYSNSELVSSIYGDLDHLIYIVDNLKFNILYRFVFSKV